MAENKNDAPQQRVAPSTVYRVEGSPDDYQYVLRGADLVLVDKKTNAEQVFMFVGNIMSLDGQVDMQFASGETLKSQDLFNRSEMPEMEKEEETNSWEVKEEGDPVSSPDGNSSDGDGLNPPGTSLHAAQAAPVVDPTRSLLSTQSSLLSSSGGSHEPKLSSDVEIEAKKKLNIEDNPDGDGEEDEKQQLIDELKQKLADETKEDPVEEEKSGTTSDSKTDSGADDGTTPSTVSKPTIELAAGEDTGLADDDNVTKNQNLKIEGEADTGSTVNIYVDGEVKATVVAEDGKYNATINGLNDGNYKIHAVATAGDVESDKSVSLGVKVDATSPGLPTMELSADSNTSVGTSDLYTNDTTLTLKGSGGEDGSQLTISYRADGGGLVTLGNATVGGDGSWSYTVKDADALPEGKYSFELTATDVAGNSASGTRYLNDVNVKTTGPSSFGLDLAASSDSFDSDAFEDGERGSDSDNLTNAGGTDSDTQNTNPVTLNVLAASDDTAKVEIFIQEGGAFTSIGNATQDAVTKIWSFDVPSDLIKEDGLYRFVAELTDQAGNIEGRNERVPLGVTIDRTAPVNAATIDLLSESDSVDSHGADDHTLIGSDDDNYTNKTTLNLKGTAAVGAPIDLYVIVDGVETLLKDDITATDGTWSYSYDASAYGKDAAQKLTFKAVVKDAADNARVTEFDVTVDQHAPTTPSIDDIQDRAGDYESNSSKTEIVVRNTSAVLNGTVDEGSTDIVLTVFKQNADGSTTAIANSVSIADGGLGGVTINNDGTWNYDYGSISNGEVFTFYVQAEDKAGNESEFSKKFVIKCDTEINAPTIDLADGYDTAGGPDGTESDDYTRYPDGDASKPVNFKVSGDDSSEIKVYLVDPSATGAADIESGGVTIGSGVLVDTVVQDGSDNWPEVSFDASAYDGTTTELTFVAVSTDKAGNSKYTEYKFTLDTEAPDAGAVTLDSGDDHGPDATDEITNAKEILLTGTLEEGSDAVKVTIYDNDVEIGIATVKSDGAGGYKWEYVIGDEDSADDADFITEGSHSYTAIVEDDAGNQTRLDALPVEIDRSIATPTFVLTSGVGSSDSGRITNDGITNADTLLFKGSSDIDDTVTIHKVDSDGNVTVVETFTAATANWDYTVANSEITADGGYKFYATTSDVAGNSKTTAQVEVTIDRSTDKPGDLDLTDASDSFYTDGVFTGGTTNSDNITNKDSITLSGDVKVGEVEVNSTVYLYLEGVTDPVGSVVLGDSDTSWSISVDKTDIPDNTEYKFYVRYEDLAGNLSDPSDSLPVTIDRDKPDTPTIAIDGVESTDFYVKSGNTYTKEIDSTFTIGNLEDGTVLNIKMDGVSVASPTVSGDSFTFNPDDFAADHSDDGVHTITVVAVDAAGNDSTEASFSFTLDTQAENISGVKLTDDTNSGSDLDTITNEVKPQIEGSAEANSSVSVVIKNSGGIEVVSGTVVADGSGNWSYPVPDGSDLPEGDYTVHVTATDYAGNEATDSSYSFTVDTSIDPVNFDMIQSEANDTGASQTDHITQNQNPEFTWSAKENLTAEISIYKEDGSLLKSYTVNSPTGVQNWSVPAGDSLDDGTYTVNAKLTDVADNTVTTDSVTVVIDRSIAEPAFVLTSGDGSSDTGRITDDGITNAATLIFNGSSDVNDTVSVHKVDSDGNDTVVSTFVATTTNWNYTVGNSEISGDGDYKFYAVTKDTAGNTKTTDNVEVTIDRSTDTPGALDLTDVSDSSYTDGAFQVGTNVDNITNKESLTFEGDVEVGGVESGATVFLYVQGTTDPVGSVILGDADTTWSISVSRDVVGEGTHNFYVRYEDLAGNLSDPSAGLEVKVDSIKPITPAIDIDGVADTDYFVHDGTVYTKELDPTFTVSGLEEGTTLNIKLNGVSVATPVADASGSYTFDPADFAADHSNDGVQTITVVAVDSAGNASDEVSYNFTLDTVAENISEVKLADISNSGLTDDVITNETKPHIEGKAEANSSVEVVIRDAGNVIVASGSVDAGADGRWNYPVPGSSELGEGDYSVHVSATDYAGNVATDSSYSFTVDTSIDPVDFSMVQTALNDTGFEADDHNTQNRNPEFIWNAKENLTAQISIYDEHGALVKSYDVDSPAGDNGWTVPGGDALADGTYTVKAVFKDVADNNVITDAGGNPVTEQVTFVIDNVAPALSVELADDSDSGIQNDWMTNDEEVAEGLQLSGTAEGGTRLYVYVNDMLTPITNAATGAENYIVVDADGDWTFDLSGLDIGSGINDGSNTIKVIAEDRAGNKTTFTKTLEVDSEVNPVGSILLADGSDSGYKGDFTTNDLTPTLNGTTEKNATVVLTVLVDGVTKDVGTVEADGSGNWSMTVADGTLTDDGIYTFTATITDDAGNTATVNRNITIDTDPMVPTLSMDVDSKGDFFGTDSDYLTNDTSPEFTVTTEVHTKLDVYLDGGVNPVATINLADNSTDGVLTYQASGLTEGTYTYRFVSTDSAGNTSETTQVVVIDPQYSADDLTIAVDAGYDSGISDSDGITNETRPLIGGTAEAGSRLRIYISDRYDSEAAADAAALGADYKTEMALPDGVTDWEYTPSTLGADGYYKVTVVSEDEAGNSQTKSMVIELDTTPPQVPTFILSDDGVDNSIISDTQTKDNTPMFAGKAEANSTVTVSVREHGSDVDVLAFTTTTDENGDWSYQVEPGDSLIDGPYNVSLTSTDNAGNDAEGSAEFLISGETPVPPTINLDSADDSNVNNDAITNQNTGLTLTGIAQSHCNVKIYVTTADDTDRNSGTLVASVEAGGNGIWAWDPGTTYADGTYYYYAKSVYSGGTEYTSENMLTLVVDTQTINPTLELVEDTGITDDWLGAAANNTATDWETSKPTLTGVVEKGATVVIEATDEHGVVAKVTIDPENLTKDGDSWSYTHTLSELADGEYTVKVTTTDQAGNVAYSPEETLVIDTSFSAPTIDLPDSSDSELNVNGSGEILFPSGADAGPALLSHLPGGFVTNNTDGYTRTNNLPLSGTADPGSLIKIEIFKDGEVFPSPDIFTVTNADGSWSYDTGVLADGLYTFRVTSTDTAGNEKQADSLDINVDASATRSAQVALNDDIPGNETSDTTPTFTLYGDSDSTWLLYLDGGTEPVATGTFNTSSYTTYTPADLTTDVDHTYKMVTVDQAGNVQVAEDFTFKIDTIAPEHQSGPEITDGALGALGKYYTGNNTADITINVEPGTAARILGIEGYNTAANAADINTGWVYDTDGDGKVTFSLDAGVVKTDGEYNNITVQYRDLAQNYDSDQDHTFDMVVDTVKPETRIELDSSSDRGFFDSDNITSGDQITLSGSILELGAGQEAGNFSTDINDYSVTITNTSTGVSQVIGSENITLNADGTWETTFGTAGHELASGDYTAKVSATDLAGNTHTSNVSFEVDNDASGVLDNGPTLGWQEVSSFGVIISSDYLPDSVNAADYKYELTYYKDNGDGTVTSLSETESNFKANGALEEFINTDTVNAYDYVGIKVIDKAGNESDSSYIDLDSGNKVEPASSGAAPAAPADSTVSFTDTDDNADVETVNVTITGDYNNDGVTDVTISGTATVTDNQWSMDFLTDLADGEYTLHLEGLDSSGDVMTAPSESTYDFTVLAEELNAGGDGGGTEAGGGESGGDPAPAPLTTDNVELEATVHTDHIDGIA